MESTRKTYLFTFRLRWCILAALLLVSVSSQSQKRDFYQLKIYKIDDARQEQRIDQYLKEAYLPAVHRAGIPNVGVFKPIEEDEMHGKMIFVLLPFKTLDQFAKLPSLLNKDSQYQKAGMDYIEAAHDNPPYNRIESILMRAFELTPRYSVPDHPTPPSERIYELRSYQGATEKLYERKVEMFNKGGESSIFIDLGFQPIFFGEVISGPEMPNLMYMTTFENRSSQSEHWRSFSQDPRWAKLRGLERYNNTVSNINKYLLHPTDYSDL